MKYALRATVAFVAAAAVVPFFAIPASAASLPTGPDGGAAGAAWTATEDGPQQYPNIHIDWDVPITMSDGTVLKANVYRPADASGRAVDVQTPAVVNLTPYTKLVSNLADHAGSIPGLSDALLGLLRQIDLSGTPLSGITDLTKAFGGGELRNFSVDRQLVRGGYTQIVVDVRGTGFSQGDWDMLRQREQQDTVEVIDWASKQPWSDGKVGMSGISYSGINQVQAAEKHPPALKAIFPIVPGSDLVDDVLAPGGGFGFNFIPLWLTAINTLKWVPDVQSILTGKFDTKWLTDRAADPLTYMDALLSAYTSTRMEDLNPRVRGLLTDFTSERKAWLGDPTEIRVPTFVTGGWHDLFTYSESKIYNQIPLPPGRKQLLMGNTYHVSSGNEYGKPGLPPRLDVLQRAWFDKWLKGIDNGIDNYGPVTLREQGGGWITQDGFGATALAEEASSYRRMYLSANRSGTANSVYDGSLTAAANNDTARLTVAPGLTTLCSNDAAQATAGALSIIDGCAKDSRVAELNALTFTSAPVAGATTISGPIAVRLNTVQDAADGYWVATVNDVAPDGQSTVLSSGQLMASLRQVDEARSTRSANGDYTDPRAFTSLDKRQPTVPGQATTLDIALPGTQAVLQPGHRLRIDVFAGNFPKGLPILPMLVDTGLKPEHVQLDPANPSFVNIPVRGNPGW
ncbi:CocE/NonD family hydrolase [Nocardia terpenica]|uniref:CocE/NonD family hydrolase n=1 Tax=Nocardia terpenica TaxID=455432 RepID=UPI0018940881|nr:CocE/NonD family hydrolase [Nocardia terpenica]MBF6060122.1 CocE/NonD family hydrolase [Nocardia terpenica]MBF6103382.1 CocE/NonD family hydrolase [Nocardia terpenica]MBF6112244.1 CocE/NonD family hydrolase [Nocardia terpenica]MBF6117603.1 CocE/NonD family hydrolase [Nocardia terpenica]MBF6153653.1 CocE/NonD family hydrolase [Nocardia terpenica]